MKETKKPASTRPVKRGAGGRDGGRLIALKRNIWRVFCLQGNGHVSSSCGHSHRTLTRAMRCTYEPAVYRRDPAAELRVRPVKTTR